MVQAPAPQSPARAAPAAHLAEMEVLQARLVALRAIYQKLLEP
jgi:hypothetical protein